MHGLSFSFSSTSRKLNQQEANSFKSPQIVSLNELDEKLRSDNLNVLKIYVLEPELVKKYGFENSDFVFLNNLYVKREFLTRKFLKLFKSQQLENNF